MHSYTCIYIYIYRFTLQEGAQGVAKKKSMHKRLDQAPCKPTQNCEGMKPQRKDNNLNTCGLADDWQING